LNYPRMPEKSPRREGRLRTNGRKARKPTTKERCQGTKTGGEKLRIKKKGAHRKNEIKKTRINRFVCKEKQSRKNFPQAGGSGRLRGAGRGIRKLSLSDWLKAHGKNFRARPRKRCKGAKKCSVHEQQKRETVQEEKKKHLNSPN